MRTDQLILASLSAVDSIGPARLRWLIAGESPSHAWARLLCDDPPVPAPPGLRPEVWRSWVTHARQADLDGLAVELGHSGHQLIDGTDPRWPFAHDPEPPVLLHAAGDLELLGAQPSVAVVGTRRCTQVGRRFATELGEGLTAAGVTVVSGLAKGIDAAVHRGVLAAGGRPVAVVATGLDVPYPAANNDLWRAVQTHGLMVTEAGPGTEPRRWRFPARNRIIAALGTVTVVVESAVNGGAMHTVAAALERDRGVMAVPGSVTNPYARGTNQLLAEGAGVAASVDDVLCAVGGSAVTSRRGTQEALCFDAVPPADRVPPVDRVPARLPAADSTDGRLLRWLGHETAAGPVSVDAVVARSGLSGHEALASLQRLDLTGAIELDRGRVTTVRGGSGSGAIGS